MDPAAPDQLLEALAALRDRAADAALALEAPGVDDARRQRRELVEQLDDYVLPRLRKLDAPLLAVVGGSTGAGKSTLVNSMVGASVTATGVRRPTTRAPILVHHPADGEWFTEQRILPAMARTTGATASPAGAEETSTLHLVPTRAMAPGLALLDAPDVDSVVTANRELAAELLGAADLWIFVTTAARYADAVPWGFLREASARSAAVAVVLDRVPPAAVEDIQAHLVEMLKEEGLGQAPLFVIPETDVADGMLPPEVIGELRGWLRKLAADAESRGEVVRRTLDGILASYSRRVPELADAVVTQERTAATLRGAAAAAYDDAAAHVEEGLRDGTLLRGEVLARWHEFVGTGDLLRNLESHVGRLRDRVTASLRGRPPAAQELAVALETGVEALVQSESDRAAERVTSQWRRTPGGAALLDEAAAGGARLDRSSPDFTKRLPRVVRDWQGAVLELVRREGADRRTTARFLAYGINGGALVVMVAVFASTAGLSGGEVAVAGGAGVLGQKVLEAVLGDQAVRALAAKARADLRDRVDALLSDEGARFTRLLARVDGSSSAALREALRAVERAR